MDEKVKREKLHLAYRCLLEFSVMFVRLSDASAVFSGAPACNFKRLSLLDMAHLDNTLVLSSTLKCMYIYISLLGVIWKRRARYPHAQLHRKMLQSR